MNTPAVTTIAGRHAADALRAHERAMQDNRQQEARYTLDDALRRHCLRTYPHFDTALGIDRTLWVNCRLATARTDHELIYAVLDEQGWQADPARLSRFRSHLDVARIRHTATDARLVLIVKVPCGATAPLEVA